MFRLLNAVKAHAAGLDASAGQPRFATVATVDPSRHAARVLLQPEGVLTGWLPVAVPFVGAGWGMVCLPAPGDQVIVLPQEGAGEHGIVVGGSYSDAAPPPAAPAGEVWLVHRSGAALHLCGDGTVRVIGDLRVSGDVYDRHGSLAQLRGHYNAHGHPDPQGGETGPPDQTD